ncbi:MAG TPA: alpha/beta fold hydrolase [Candidatus Acidoferrales bacterium]|nr:alpha/beta fold hydrolase [Candidatus Acidoferrales bacterium]
MKRSTFVGAAAAALVVAAKSPAAAAESDIALHTATGTIAGTLSLPAATPAPVVLIVAGSGPTDRDGNSGLIAPGTYRLLAAALASRGVASVRYDKRGVGASASAAASEKDLRFETYIGDAVAWMQLLASDRRFTKLVVAGHSEGSLIGIVAVQQTPAAALVSLEGAGRPAYEVLREQLKPKTPPALYAQCDAIITQLQQGHTVAEVPGELYALFRPSVQPYLISWFAYDPAKEMTKVKIPATIVQGTADVQVTMADARALHAADPASQLVVVQGMNHVLKHAPDVSSQTAILHGYQDSSLPVDPQAVDPVAAAAR